MYDVTNDLDEAYLEDVRLVTTFYVFQENRVCGEGNS